MISWNGFFTRESNDFQWKISTKSAHCCIFLNLTRRSLITDSSFFAYESNVRLVFSCGSEPRTKLLKWATRRKLRCNCRQAYYSYTSYLWLEALHVHSKHWNMRFLPEFAISAQRNSRNRTDCIASCFFPIYIRILQPFALAALISSFVEWQTQCLYDTNTDELWWLKEVAGRHIRLCQFTLCRYSYFLFNILRYKCKSPQIYCNFISIPMTIQTFVRFDFNGFQLNWRHY